MFGCSVCGVAFHSFVWPRVHRAANVIARTLFTTHGAWAGVLVLRGRCVCSRKSCHASSRLFENILWHLAQTRRQFVVYKEGRAETGVGDPVPVWFGTRSWYDRFCQCISIGMRCREWFGQFNEGGVYIGWQHPGSLCTDIHNMQVVFGMGLFFRGLPFGHVCVGMPVSTARTRIDKTHNTA